MAANFGTDNLSDELTLEEAVSLTAGRAMWTTQPVPRLGIERMRVSDGPAGVRGSRFDGPPSMNVPCGTAIAATWDPATVRAIGELLARELEAKGARVLLAPTVNIHRTPVGGRNFECFSEDPLLSAITAVEYVRGVQSAGLAACIKHFVGNDTETERMTIDSRIDERTMREIYLVPFERAVRDAGVMAVMSAYNKVNGPHAADSSWLLTDVLRNEWGFDGAVVSDWFGLHSTVEAVVAGLDLEMPGPPIHRGEKLRAAVHDGLVSEEAVRKRASNVLRLLARTGGIDRPPGAETSRDDESDLALLRRAAAAGMVLVKNSDVLPLVTSTLSSVAVIGPNAERASIMGGGSAHVTPTRESHPLDAITRRFGPLGVSVRNEQGCRINKKALEIPVRSLDDTRVEYFSSPGDLDGDHAPERTERPDSLRFMWFTDPLGRRGSNPLGVRITSVFTPEVSGEWVFGVESTGATRVLIDGVQVIDNSLTPAGGSFFGSGKPEVTGAVALSADVAVSVTVEMRSVPGAMGVTGLNVGATPPDPGDGIERAAALAAECDVAVVVVGTNDDWESEGWDRADIGLPGEQDRLISDVARVARRTVVVVNAGSPVSMPWIDEVDAVIVTWFPGQEMGDALVDIMCGDVEPTGRLPVTFPRVLDDTPAFEHHPGRGGIADYRERRLVGYRWYDTVGRAPLFEFGFGLGYANPMITSATTDTSHRVVVTLRNDADRAGTQVVQVYAHLVDRTALAPDEPDQRLVGWSRVTVPSSDQAEVVVDLDVDAYRAWNVEASSWMQWSGEIELRVGTSSRHIAERIRLVI
ncbi:MAG: glycoside hydrolase family 3 protein [Ilumatobacteraceae bacterium]